MTIPFDRASAAVREATTCQVVGHINPDADAIGAVCAVVAGLRQCGVAAGGFIGQSHAVAEELLSIPGAEEITVAEQPLPPGEVTIIVDCGALSRTGYHEQEILRRIADNPERVILIDHHASNPGIDGINLLDVGAESTTTVIYEWMSQLGVVVDRKIAHALYAGLLTDTGGFRWGRPRMHTMASELVSYGLDIRGISSTLFGGMATEDLRAIGGVMANLRLVSSDCHRLVVATVDHRLTQQIDHSSIEKIADFLRGVPDADIAVVLKEYTPGAFTVSFRSHTMDVSALAKPLGGGGHLRASGATLTGTAEEVIQQIIETASGTCPVTPTR